MKKLFALLIWLLAVINASAQNTALSTVQPYGTVDTADLKMTQCSFEKNANAMVLFDKGKVTFTLFGNVME